MAKENQRGFFRDVKLNSEGGLKISDTLSLSEGVVDGHSYINKFGKNYDVDSGSLPEYLWSKGGIYIPPTQARTHSITSTSNQDKAVKLSANIITNVFYLINGDIEIICDAATFITDGTSIGDKFIDKSILDHTLIVSVDSETQITIQPLHDNGLIDIGNIIDIVTMIGNGAGILHIFGLDEDCNEIKEFLILDGINSVLTVNQYLRINRCHTDLTGNLSYNNGNIDILALVDGTSTAWIEAEDGQTLQAFYTIPNGKTGYLSSINLSSHRIGNTSNAMISATLRETKFIPQGTIGIIEDTISVSLVGTSFTQKEYNPYKAFAQRTDIWLQIDYSTDNNMIVSGGFDVILTDNNHNQ